MILTGPALHLWFLPFAFIICLAAYPVMRLASLPLSMVLVAAGLSALLVLQYHALPTPFAQWLYALPAVCLGLGLALVQGRLGLQALFLGGFLLGALALGATAGLAQLMLAALGFLICTALPMRSTPLSRWAAAAAMGVYLVHPLVLSLLERITPLARDSVVMALLGCAVALAISLCLLLVTTRHNGRRDEIPHEQVLARPLNTTF